MDSNSLLSNLKQLNLLIQIAIFKLLLFPRTICKIPVVEILTNSQGIQVRSRLLEAYSLKRDSLESLKTPLYPTRTEIGLIIWIP